MTFFTDIQGYKIPCFSYDALIVGAGAAGLCAADELFSLGVKNIAVLSENVRGGTSRCAGSDKQTFYKLTTTGSTPDSVRDLAETLFSGGSMHGDIALTIAAGSLRAFCKLVLLGVPFPENEFGEYVGYRTDNDERKRATSCGPLTSKYMAEALEASVKAKNIPILDGYRALEIITNDNRALGVLASGERLVSAENPMGLAVISAGAVVWAVGGPSDIYSASVYPQSQGCSMGAPLRAGAEAVNLTESQFGIASVGFRWNLSGSYQQVIPRYASVDENGVEHEFLCDYFSTPDMILNVFKKGYEWPFDAAKAGGSSRVDLAVMAEKARGRRVYLDFTKNPTEYDENALPQEAAEYLKNSDALGGTPYGRLLKLNSRAVELFKSNGIDLEKEYLEIDVCAQHLNGGFDTDTFGESTNIENLYFVGECAGNYGVKRPGGSALLAGQVMAHRAAEKIAERGVKSDAESICGSAKSSDIFRYRKGDMTRDTLFGKVVSYGKTLTESGGVIRNYTNAINAKKAVIAELNGFYDKYALASLSLVREAEKCRDILTTQYAYLCTISDYIKEKGKSRGGYIVTDKTAGELAADGTSVEIDTSHGHFIQKTFSSGGEFISKFVPVRPIPESEQWFEKVYKKRP